ncbi:8891_t:CDS:2, partial [Entrophospora sp. SA101]
ASEMVNIRHRDWQVNSLRILGKGNKVRYTLIPDFLTKHFKPSPHTFRRSLATNLYNRGGRLETIQKQLGHSTIQTTLGYIHNDFNTLYQDYSKIFQERPKANQSLRDYSTAELLAEISQRAGANNSKATSTAKASNSTPAEYLSRSMKTKSEFSINKLITPLDLPITGKIYPKNAPLSLPSPKPTKLKRSATD